VINIGLNLLNWLFNRSPQNAANPQVPQNTPPEIPDPDIRPIESYAETDSIIGTSLKVGLVEKAFQSNGQLVRTHDNLKMVIGCNHLIHQLQAEDQKEKHIVGVAGACVYCEQELQQLLEKGKINQFDAERSSLVCTDCAQVTKSGELCCPKHYKAVSSSDGTKTYLSSEDIKEQKREDTKQIANNTFAMLFGSNNQSKEQTDE